MLIRSQELFIDTNSQAFADAREVNAADDEILSTVSKSLSVNVLL